MLCAYLMNELIQRAKNKKAAASSDRPLAVVPTRKLTAQEIANASDTVRANLTDVLVKISAKLASLPDNLIGVQNLAQVAKLTDTASKLFCWPNPKPVDTSAQSAQPTAAINLALIRTTPEQLREAAAAKRQTAVN
jgi:hypothetical protein